MKVGVRGTHFFPAHRWRSPVLFYDQILRGDVFIGVSHALHHNGPQNFSTPNADA